MPPAVSQPRLVLTLKNGTRVNLPLPGNYQDREDTNRGANRPAFSGLAQLVFVAAAPRVLRSEVRN